MATQRLEQNGQARLMASARAIGRRTFPALLCLAIVVWSVIPAVTHTPKVVQTIQDHLEMIGDHGHSHGFEEDLAWALHGHSHDVGDHDHSQVLLVTSEGSGALVSYRDRWRMQLSSRGSGRNFRIERPSRA